VHLTAFFDCKKHLKPVILDSMCVSSIMLV